MFSHSTLGIGGRFEEGAMLPSFVSRLAIIPAKASSERCAGKNMRLFAGIPLFMHSVYYARQEGFLPVVSTDSAEIMEMCRKAGVACMSEVVDDRRMENCIDQVLARVGCDLFALLQPTSPFRWPGLLQRMAEGAGLDAGSLYTAQRIKLIGHLDGHFQAAYREQDARRFLDFFDGNILVMSRSRFLGTGVLLDDDSRPCFHEFPCHLQIDTEEQFSLLDDWAGLPGTARLLAVHNRPLKVCIVSNRRCFRRDYSDFVDSCDVVIRVSKMDNLDSGLAGRRTDAVVVSCWSHYMAFTREERHVEELKRAPLIYFSLDETRFARSYAEAEGLLRWKFIPESVQKATPHFTTVTKAVALADALYPEAQLYYLGDLSASLRTDGNVSHSRSGDDSFMAELVESGRLVCLLEETSEAGYEYSREIGEGTQGLARELWLKYGEGIEADAVLELRHPCWSDTVRVFGGRARREHGGGDKARAEFRQEGELVLHWERWPAEVFVETAENTYKFVSRLTR